MDCSLRVVDGNELRFFGQYVCAANPVILDEMLPWVCSFDLSSKYVGPYDTDDTVDVIRMIVRRTVASSVFLFFSSMVKSVSVPRKIVYQTFCISLRQWRVISTRCEFQYPQFAKLNRLESMTTMICPATGDAGMLRQ